MKTRAGQITMEYFILLAVIVLATLIGLSTFHTDIATTFQEKVFKPAVEHMPLDDDKGSANSNVPTDPTPPDVQIP